MLLKKLGAATIIYGLGGVLNRGVSLLLLPLLTQFLDKKAYGVSGLLQIISFFYNSNIFDGAWQFPKRLLFQAFQ